MTSNYPLRLEDDDMKELRVVAERAERPVAEELRLAIKLHLLRIRLAYASTPDGVAALKEARRDAKTEIAYIKRCIAAKEALLYQAEPPTDVAPGHWRISS